MIDYQKELFMLRMIKNIYSLLYDIAMAFFVYWRIWDFTIFVISKWSWGLDWRKDGSWCEGDWYVQYPALIMFAILFKLAEILAHVTFHWYQTFKISKKYGFSEATCGTFIYDKVAALLEFLILVGPLSILMVGLLQITGKYIALCCLLLTPIFKFLVLWLYPRVIMPLFAEYKVFP